MKIGDNVIRKWKPMLGEGKIIHLLGETVVVKWLRDGKPEIGLEEKRYIKVINEDR
tara:strand:- start:69 stop:236 length:168 start_codon:yes stop_codon:yes gene_type:complete